MSETVKERQPRQSDDEADLRLIKKMKQMVDKGYNVELRKDGKGYKALRVEKKIISA